MLEAAEEALSIAENRSRVSMLAVMKDVEIIGEAAPRHFGPRNLDFHGRISSACETV